MTARPSAPLLALLRDVAKKKGLNTAALARLTNLDKHRLKHVLAGAEPLTVDELVVLSTALELNPAELAQSPAADAGAPEALPTAGPVREGAATIGNLEQLTVDPWGNQAEQILRLGFALGCDIHVALDSAQLAGSGAPESVLRRYPQKLPLHFEAAWHKHHAPSFAADGVTVRLSFDALYTCVLPWAAFHQITLFPLPPSDAPEPPSEEAEPPAPGPRKGGHLRLVE